MSNATAERQSKIWLETLRLTGFQLLIAFSLVSSASGEDKDIPGAPRLIPSDTLAYVRLDSAEQFRKDFTESSVGQMLNDPALKPLSGEVYQLSLIHI